mgnify:CR=1 FL=1
MKSGARLTRIHIGRFGEAEGRGLVIPRCVHYHAHMSNEKQIDKLLTNIDNDFVKALAEPARIEILKLLVLQGACDVGTLAEKMPQDRSVISRHLATMKQAGLLDGQKEGRHVVYRLNGSVMLEKSELLVESIRQCIKLGCC